jgi:hypothetical protein
MIFLLAVQQKKYHTIIMRTLNTLIALILFLVPMQATAGSSYDYQLYKNQENYGIVIFPKKFISKELRDHISSISFLKVESGKAVMRRGTKNENESLMMPIDVQKKHSIEKFIVIQVLTEREMLAGVYDPQWGLTLPSSSFGLEAFKTNIDKTLNVFRGDNPQRKIKIHLRGSTFLKEQVFDSHYHTLSFNIKGILQLVQHLGEINARI